MRLRAGQGGQASVELALALPLVFLLALAVLQVALVGRDAVLVAHAAREGARAAAVAPGSAASAARGSGGLAPSRVRVDEQAEGGRVVVTVRYESPTRLPLVGPLVPDVRLKAAVTFRREGRSASR